MSKKEGDIFIGGGGVSSNFETQGGRPQESEPFSDQTQTKSSAPDMLHLQTQINNEYADFPM